MTKSFFALCIAATCLSACGGGSGPEVVEGVTLPTGPSAFVEDVRGATLLDVKFLDNIGGGTVEPTGAAPLSYSGFMTIAYNIGSSDTVGFYLGQSDATFDPATSSVNGSADSFHRSTLRLTSPSTGVVSNGTAVGGTVTYSGTGFDAFSEIATTYSGTVDGKTVAGTGTTAFFANNGQFLESQSQSVTLDGDVAEISVVVEQ